MLCVLKGIRVRVLARNPQSLSEFSTHPLITIIKGDALKPFDVEKLITSDVDGVFCALGVGKNEPTNVVADGTRNALQAMRKLIKPMHYVLVTSHGTIESDNWFYNNIIRKHLLNHIYDDLKNAEDIVQQVANNDPNITFSVVRPPQLSDTPLTMDYTIGVGFEMAKGKDILAREDVADCMIRCMFGKYDLGHYNLDTTNKCISLNSNRSIKADPVLVVMKKVLPTRQWYTLQFIFWLGFTSISTAAFFSGKYLWNRFNK